MHTNHQTNTATDVISNRVRRGIAAACLVVAMLATLLGSALAFGASAASATPNSPSTLTGESLQTAHGTGSTTGADFTCTSTDGGATLAFSVSGTASGPYPGTFTESGTFTKNTFQASFTITSGSTTVTGTKTSGVEGSSCNDAFDAVSGHMPYTATIATSTGNFGDSGAANTQAYVGQTSFFTTDNAPNGIPNLCVSPGTTNLIPCPFGTTAVASEQFQSSLTVPTRLCSMTITGNNNSALVVPAGKIVCIINAQISGAIVVQPGGSLVVSHSTLRGGIGADRPASVQLCGSAFNGGVVITGATGFVLIGDPGDDQCAANRFKGALVLQDNTHGLEVIGNRLSGALIARSNAGVGPFPEDTAPDISGNSR